MARVGGPQTQGHHPPFHRPPPHGYQGAMAVESNGEKMLGGDLCRLQGAGWLGAAEG